MSGKRQHYIPRFLLEGFCSHVARGGSYAWVFPAKSEPFNTNLINIGVEGFFYDDGERKVDASITKAEETHSEVITALRDGASRVINDDRVADLIAHLESRTRNLRLSFLAVGEVFVTRLMEFMNDDSRFLPFLERELRKRPEIVEKSLGDEIERLGLPPATRELLPSPEALIQQFFEEMVVPNFKLFAAQIRSGISRALVAGAKSGHLRGLTESQPPAWKLEEYRRLVYRVIDYADRHLILGDSAVFFQVRETSRLKSFWQRDEGVSVVFLPISATRILIGSRDETSHASPVLAAAAAACSLQFFVAPENTIVQQELQAKIGEAPAFLENDGVKEALREFLSDFEA